MTEKKITNEMRSVLSEEGVRAGLRAEVERLRRDKIERTRHVDDALLREIGVTRQRIHHASLARVSAKAKMTPDEVAVAFRSYEDGVPIRKLAADLWKKHGYMSLDACAGSLQQRFVSLGLIKQVA